MSNPKHNVDDVVETAILIALKSFLSNESISELDFPSSFTTAERAFVHQKANQNGLVSRSIGRNSSRYVSIRKKRHKEVIQSPMFFDCGQNSRRVLHTLLHRWPVRQKEKQDVFLCHEKLFNQITDFRSDMNKPSGRLPNGIPQIPTQRLPSPYDNYRATLPIAASKDEIIKKIRDHQVVIICGEAGVGKTTQVPQFILDECLDRNEACRIVCTQTHRISAVSMAERVSLERGECVGQAIGYQIRLESRASPRTLLTFCTNGVLLRTLMSRNNVVKSITHIIVDEINERDHYSDFLLVRLRQLLSSASSKDFRLILLGSPINIGIFQEYFKGSAVVQIPKKTKDVRELFLDDVLLSTGYLDKEVLQIRRERDRIKNQAKEMKEWLKHEKNLQSPDNTRLSDSSYKDESLDHEVQNITMKNSGNREMTLNDAVTCQFEKFIYDAWFEKQCSNLEEIYVQVTSNKISVDTRHSKTGITALMTSALLGDNDLVDKFLAAGADPSVIAPNGMVAGDFSAHAGHKELAKFLKNLVEPKISDINEIEKFNEKELVRLYYTKNRGTDIDFNLIACLLEMVCNKTEEGSILIFLPTYDDIIVLRDLIMSRCQIANKSSIRLFILLSSLQMSSDQKQAFQPSPAGTRKIILATDIAESAVTIDDVVHVIDSGKSLITSYDSLSSASNSRCDWISHSNVVQRTALAGRARSGTCYHLFTRNMLNAMRKTKAPSLVCVPLYELCLQVKLLCTTDMNAPSQEVACSIIDYFMDAPTTPPLPNITHAIASLKEIEALDSFENVTELGRHLIDLPIEPRLGKMILYGVVLKCLDPILTISCSLAHSHPFINPTQAFKKQKANESKLKFSAGTFSDHMCLLRAFQAWQKARSDGWEQSFCQRNFMSQATMETIVAMRSQLLGQLRATGFVRARGGNDIRDLNTNSENWAVVKAAICASSFPNLLHFDRKSNRLFSSTNKNVWLDSSSVLSRSTMSNDKTHPTALEALPADWIVYDQLRRTSTEEDSVALAKCCTVVSSACIALFAGQAYISEKSDTVINPDIQQGETSEDGDGYAPESDNSDTEDRDVSRMSKVLISKWIKLQMEPTLAHLMLQLRTKWYSLFFRRIHNPSKSWQAEDEAVLSAIINILSSEDQAARLTQPSGIGQRPRPVTQDDGNKSSCFIPKTPTSVDNKAPKENVNTFNTMNNSNMSINVNKKHSKSLNFSGDSSHSVDENQYCTLNFNSLSADASPNYTDPYFNKKNSNQYSKQNCCFVYTIKKIQEVQMLKNTGKWTVPKDLRNIFIERLKYESVYVFFVMEGMETLQDIVKLVENSTDGSFQLVWLQQSRTAGQPIKRLWHNGNNQKIYDGVLILERAIADILVQLVDTPTTQQQKIPPTQNTTRGLLQQNFHHQQQQYMLQPQPVTYVSSFFNKPPQN